MRTRLGSADVASKEVISTAQVEWVVSRASIIATTNPPSARGDRAPTFFSCWSALAVAAAGVAGGCGGATSTTQLLGGESHFLDRCTTNCEDGLDCISGLCTRGAALFQSDRGEAGVR